MYFRNHLLNIYQNCRSEDKILPLPASNTSMASPCTWPEMKTPTLHIIYAFSLYPKPLPLGLCSWTLATLCLSLFLKHSAHLYLQVVPPDFLFLERFLGSSWHAWLFPCNHFSTQKLSLKTPVLPHHQQADLLDTSLLLFAYGTI